MKCATVLPIGWETIVPAIVICLLIVGLVAWWIYDTSQTIKVQNANYSSLYQQWAELDRVRVLETAGADEQAVRDHQALLDQYRSMIDDLYDHAEQTISREHPLREDDLNGRSRGAA